MPPPFAPPVVLEGHGVRLEPMEVGHEAGLREAATGIQIQVYMSVPEPENAVGYIKAALAEREKGVRQPFVVRELAGGQIVGSTSYHDIIPEVRRVEIGYTWYGRNWQRTYVNTACKWLLLEHAFETLNCSVDSMTDEEWRSGGQSHVFGLLHAPRSASGQPPGR